MFVQSLAQNVRRTDCVGPILSRILAPNIESILKPSNYDAEPLFCTFTAQNPKCPRRFGDINPEKLHTCVMYPAEARALTSYLLYSVFFAGSLGSL